MLIVHHRVTKIDLHYHHTSSLPKSIVSATNFSRNGRFGVSQVRFTPSTMKSEHGRWTFSRIRLYDPTSMVRFVKWSLYNGPCTKNWMCWLFHTCPERAVLKNIQVWPLFLGFFFLLHFLSILFSLFSLWISASIVVMEVMRRRLILFLRLYMLLYMLVKHVVDIQGLLLQGEWEKFAILSLVYEFMEYRERSIWN